jgi:RecA-family ATPase
VWRVHALSGWTAHDPDGQEVQSGGVTLGDVALLRQVLAETRPTLIVIDPLQAFLGAQVDIHRDNETGPILAGLAVLAERYHCAMLIIRHLGKSSPDGPVYRGVGSIDLAAAAPSILLAAQDPQSPNSSRRVLAQAKSSLAALGRS